MKPTIATRFATPPANIATSSGTIHAPSSPSTTSGSVAAACTSSPPATARRAPDARDHARPEHPAQHGARAEHRERGPGGQRRVAEHLLQVEREQEHQPRLGGEGQHPGEVAPARRVAAAQHPQRHERLGDARLDRDERDEQCRRRRAARPVRVVDAVDERQQRERHQQRAGDVEAATPARTPRGRLSASTSGATRQHGRRDGDVDEERPAPAQHVGQQRRRASRRS